MSERDTRTRGPLVYLDYDQRELDAQYDQRTLVRDTSHEKAWRTGSDAARTDLRMQADLAYDEGARQRLDLFLPEGKGPFPVVLFLHGGAWTRHDKGKFAFPAPAFVGEGVAFACAGFDLVPQVSLGEQVRQARAALDWLQSKAPDLDLDADAVFVAGHSSGAHLAASLITGHDAADIKGALLMSGIYDLEPVRLSARNEYLHLDEEQALSLSPIAHIPSAPCPAIIAWGDGELEEFQRQSRAFADAWEAAGGSVTRLLMSGRNHFTITHELADSTSDPVSAILELIESWR